MGSSVYPVVGRIRRTLPNLLLGESNNPLRTEGLLPSDFEFLGPDDDAPLINGNFDVHLHSNYQLFSWLAEVRGDVMPLPDRIENHEASEAFCRWLDTGTPNYLDTMWEPLILNEGFYDRYISGWGGPYIRSIDWLLNYNYDVVAQLQPDDMKDYVYDVVQCKYVYTGHGVPHPELKTYRELFNQVDDEYFRFLEAVKANDWDFVIFKFD